MNRYEKLNQNRIVEEKICVEQKTYKVGAYCRVSTDKEDQANSLKANSDILRNTLNVVRIGNW